MRIYAFQGLRYQRPAGEIDPLVAPPYDQIDAAYRDELHARHPLQFSWLTCPVPGAESDPYRESARLHGAWLADGTLHRDEEPSLYPYAIDLESGSRRLGLCALVGVEDSVSGIIRAHEETVAKPLADRVALLKANRVDLEPVFFLPDDGGALDLLLAEDVAAGEPVARHRDPDGNHHLLYRLASPTRIARYRELLAPLPAAIADGHHRYKTACLFARESGAQPGTAAATKMTVITSISSPGLIIDPIHRALPRGLDLGRCTPLLLGRRPVEVEGGPELAAEVARSPQPALGVWQAGQVPEVWQLDPAKAPASIPASARGLAVSLLHGMLLAELGYAAESAVDGTVIYRSSPAKLASELLDGTHAVGLFLPPMLPGEFAAAIAHGDLLPPKSTRFLPKVFSGLVWADHDSKLA